MRLFGIGWIDLLVVAACGLTFATALAPHGHRAPAGPPTPEDIQAIAEELGVTVDQMHRAAELVPPPARGTRPSPLERDKSHVALAGVLNVSVDRLDTVMRRHRPPNCD